MNRQYIPFQPVRPITVRTVAVPRLFNYRTVAHTSDTLCHREDPASAYVLSSDRGITQITTREYFLVPLFEWDDDRLSRLLEFFIGAVRPVEGDDPRLSNFTTSLSVRTDQGGYRLHYSEPIGVHYSNTLTGEQGAVLFDHNCAVVSPD